MKTINLGNNIEIRDDIHLGKKEFLEKLGKDSIKYINGFTRIIYYNFFNNKRNEIFDRDNLYSVENIHDDIINPYYHHLDSNYQTFDQKVWYNSLNRETKKYYSQLSSNFIGYAKFILKNINKKIEYKNDEFILYKPKSKGKTDSLILNSDKIIEQISDKLAVFDLTIYDIYEELKDKTCSDIIKININDYNIQPKKYYFKDNNSEEIIVDFELINEKEEYLDKKGNIKSRISINAKKYLVSLVNKYNLTDFIYKKFKPQTINGLSIPLDDRFYSRNMDKEDLKSIIESQIIQDKNIGNQYFLKIKNIYKKGTDIKIPLKYDSYVFGLMKNRYHKKYKLEIDKIGISIVFSSHFIKNNDKNSDIKGHYEYNTNFKLNSTYHVESKMKDNKIIRLLGYDLGYNNSLSGQIVGIDNINIDDYIKNIKENKKLNHDERIKKISKNIKIKKTKSINKINFSAKNFNRKIIKINDKIDFCKSKLEDGDNSQYKDEIKKLWKQMAGIKKSWIGFILNKLILDYNINLFIGEDLNLKGKKENYKGLNKINTSILYGQINKALKYKVGITGGHQAIVFSEISSIFCNKCGCINSENRKNQEFFSCINCHYDENADINAGENIISFFLNGFTTKFY